MAAEIVVETISLAIHAGSIPPKLGLVSMASIETADAPPPRPVASSLETERPPL